MTAAQPIASVSGIFGRDPELAELKNRLCGNRSFLLHGRSGAGKTLLVRSVIENDPRVLYCADSRCGHSVFHTLACELVRLNDVRLRKACGKWGVTTLRDKSVLVLRGLVLSALREGNYVAVLDHLSSTSAGLASDIRDMMLCAGTLVVAITRSEHMEDTGFLGSYFALRSERMRIAPLPRNAALVFAHLTADRFGLQASNRAELLERVVGISAGLPGVIVALLRMSLSPKYRTEQYVKLSPLYIDFRLAWHAANAR